MKIIIVANVDWQSLRKKTDNLAKWFKPLVDIKFDIVYTKFDDIPFTPYITNTREAMLGVDRLWYDKNITTLGFGSDMVLFLIPRKQWKEPNRARGWRTDNDFGPVELQVTSDEKETGKAGGWLQFDKDISSFELLARHEILHGMYLISNQEDKVHYWWDKGDIEQCLKDIILPKNYQLISLTKTLNYLKSLLQKEHPLVSLSKNKLNTDFTNDQVVPDEVSCAYATTTILKEYNPKYPIIIGTHSLLNFFQKSSDFTRVYEPQAGDIVICATGTNSRPDVIPNGHVGIYLDNTRICSNDSASGLWKQNYTRETWRNRYFTKGGYAVYLYRLKI